MPTRPRAAVRPRIRVTSGETILLGPGKADLLAAIAETGSLRAAASRLGMSYMRAWSLVRTMNAAFATPLVDRQRGGSAHGSAHLTARGEKVLALYREMESEAMAALAPSWRKLRRLLGASRD